jgi:hypothetical protein
VKSPRQRLVMPAEIRGTDLPGRRCGPKRHGQMYENIHVGIGRGDTMVGLIPGDAPTARWPIELAVRVGDEGDIDFGGPLVSGRRGERFLYLSWGTVAPDGTFTLFRAAKLWLSEVPPSMVQEALRPGRRLIGSLGLTDCKGYPRCASVRPPDIVWSVEEGSNARQKSMTVSEVTG